MPSTQINTIDGIYRQTYTGAIIERDAWENTFHMVSTPAWVSARPIIRDQWRGGYQGVPRQDTDAMEILMRSYAAVPTRWITAVDADNGVITVGYRPESVPEFNEAWTVQWTNIALAHAAAVFCLEVIYDGKEHRVVNADAIRAAIGA